jgi:subtilase family serine protease
MSSILRKIVRAALAASLLVLWPAGALRAASSSAAAGSVTLTGHVPPQIRSATRLARVDADENVDLSLVVSIDQALMDRTLAELYGPNAAPNRHFLTPAEFIQKFDLARKRQAIKDFAAASGLALDVAEDRPGSLVVKVSGPARAVENAFGVQLNHYRAADGQVFRGHETDPVIPAALAPHLHAVMGLSNYRGVARPHLRVRGRAPGAGALPAAGSPGASNRSFSGNGVGGGLAPSDIKSIYSLSGALTGSGQTVALAEFDGYAQSDVAGYESQFGLPNTPVTFVSVDSQANLCGVSQNQTCNATTLAGDNGMLEVALDIDMMISLAPGVSQIEVYTAPNLLAKIVDAYARIASDNTAKSVSTSWGVDEQYAYDNDNTFMTSEATIFQQMATQGQTIFAAAGDQGAYDGGGHTSLLVDDPASQPYVTGVGGTSLSGTLSSFTETVWNDGCVDSSGNSEACTVSGASYEAGGGGIANYAGTYWPIPTSPTSWQTGVTGTQSQTYRNVPDVTLNADPNASPYTPYVGGGFYYVGGTSAAAPLWAAMMALANQQRATNGYGSFGFANPTFYQLGTGGSHATYFEDITSGSNGYYSAGTGYDNASGLGSFHGNNLIGALAPAPVPVITSALSKSGTVGTAFSYTITASNSPTSYNASGLPSGLSVNTSNGVISGTPSAAGTVSATISATNAGGTGSATLVFTINPPPPVINSSLTASGTAGAAFSYSITATNSPTSYSASGLPSGLSVNTSNGVISGTPASAGSASVTIRATNAGGTGSATLSLTIGNPPAPVVTSALSASGTAGSAFNYSITASNGPTSYSASGLPSGLGINTSNGVISGTPASAGTSNVTIGAANAGGTGTATLVLTIAAAAGSAPAITSSLSASGTSGVAFNYTITASHSPTSYNAVNLPAGLSVNTSNGVISGTPASAGTTDATISAVNGSGTGTATLVFTINPPHPVITSALTTSGTAGGSFGYTITASNSPTSYGAANLPAGLSVNTSNGVISGTPTTAGTVSATVSATNAGGTGSATLVFTIDPAAPTTPVITSALDVSGIVGTSFSYAIVASNSPTSYNAPDGLPAGLSINTSNGAISGTPTSPGILSFTISATNPSGTGQAVLVFTIYNALSSGTVSSSGITLTLPTATVVPQLTSINVIVPPGAFPPGTPISAGVDLGASLPGAVTNEASSITPFGANGLILSAGGLQPTSPVSITMAYNFTLIPLGQSESHLQLWRYDTTALQWTLVPSQVDTAGHVLTAQTSHFSTFAPFFVAAGSDVSSVQVYPQPWEMIGDASNQYWASMLTLSGLPGGATVKFFTIRGELVWSGTADAGGTLFWNGNNRFGRGVASGTYYATFQNGGQTKVRRLVIIR